MSSLNANTVKTTTIQHTNGTQALVVNTDGNISAGIITATQIAGGGLTLATAKSATGTSVDFTEIPSWVKRITVSIYGISIGTAVVDPGSRFLIRLGTSGGFVTSGYRSSATEPGNGSAQSTAGLVIIRQNTNIANVYTGNYQLINLTSDTWIGSGVISPMNGVGSLSSGDVNLGEKLTQLRITTVNGTDTFDAGTINIMYEG